MTASPGDGEHAAREGYYPDPSIPGYVRFWNGLNWVPGTSRPAVAADETGPVFLDETGVTEALREPERWPEPAPAPEPVRDPEPEPVVWQADPFHQSGFGGPRDDRVSWGHEPPAAAARSAGISLARTPVPAPAPAPGPAHAAVPVPVPVPAPVPAQVSGSPAPEGVGILSARSPVREAPAPAPVWPAPASPEAPARPVRRAAPAAERARHLDFGPGVDPDADLNLNGNANGNANANVNIDADRAAHAAPAPSAKLADRARRPAPATPVAPAPAPAASPEPAASRPATQRAVFERMAERAVRPAGLVRRASARFLDSLVYAGVAAGTALPLVPEATAHLQAKVDAARSTGRTTTVWLFDATIAGQVGLVLGAVLLFGILYEALPTARWGRTPGKKLLGVRVLATATLRPPRFGAALRRWLVYAFLGLPGVLWALADRPRRRALHDRAARTYVAR